MSYLEADLIRGLFRVSFDHVSRSHGRCVDGPVIGHNETVASVIELEPIEHGSTGDNWTGQRREPTKIAWKQLPYRILEREMNERLVNEWMNE